MNHGIAGGKGFRQTAAPILSAPHSGKKDGQFTEKKNKILETLNSKFASVDFPALSQIREWMSTERLPNYGSTDYRDKVQDRPA